MWISNLPTIVSISIVLIFHSKYVQCAPRRMIFRIRTKGSSSSLPPFLTLPSLTSAPSFHSNYEMPPFLMPSSQSHGSQMHITNNELSDTDYSPPPSPSQDYGPPSQQYGPPSQQYGPPSQEMPSSYAAPAAEYGPPSTKPMIHKHIYVHIPPPEPENPKARKPFTTAAPQKHYRIVFIKAPTSAPVTMPTIPMQPPDEEKTLVYVLVKKPDDLPELVLPKPVTTPPSKPEVYFIRYQAQKESNDGPYPAAMYPKTSATLGPPLAPFGKKNRFNTPK